MSFEKTFVSLAEIFTAGVLMSEIISSTNKLHFVSWLHFKKGAENCLEKCSEKILDQKMSCLLCCLYMSRLFIEDRLSLHQLCLWAFLHLFSGTCVLCSDFWPRGY